MSEENRWIELADHGAQIRVQRFGTKPEKLLASPFVEGELRRLTGSSEGRQVLRELYAQLHPLPPCCSTPTRAMFTGFSSAFVKALERATELRKVVAKP